MKKITRTFIVLFALLESLFVFQTTAFVVQGGFGAGHGNLDTLIAFPGLAWLWFYDFVQINDYLGIIFFPWLFNNAFLFAAYWAIRGWLMRKKAAAPTS